MEAPAIQTVTADNRQRALQTATAAFATDPLMRWCFPEPASYLEHFPRLVDAFAGGSFDHSAAEVVHDYSGTALWVPPGVEPDEEALGTMIAETLRPEILEDFAGVMTEMENYHPKDDVTWYLAVIGVDPFYQRRGLGAALLSHKLREIDSKGLPAYLESSNPANMSLYERHGFVSMGRIQIGTSPPVHPMIREARR